MQRPELAHNIDAVVTVHVRRYADPQHFLDRCRAWLLRSEIENSQILATAQLLAENDHAFEAPFYLATVESETDIVGCAVRAPPDHLILSRLPLEAMPLLAAEVATVYDKLPGVSGKEIEATAFAALWTRRVGEGWAVTKRWRWYALERVTKPKTRPSGSLRLARSGELQLVRTWARNFARETGVCTDVVSYYERRVQTGSLYLWDDGAPRAAVAVSGVTPNTIRLSGVYTASEFRRQGYATATVASVSQRMLDAGHEICLLFADTAHSDHSPLYTNIGYRPIFDRVSICLSE
jgi:GNAT superfamily N-acetyltransferase